MEQKETKMDVNAILNMVEKAIPNEKADMNIPLIVRSAFHRP